MAEGTIYILTNEAMPGFVKIGKTADRDVAGRIRALSNTSVPFAFECSFAARVSDMDLAERLLHDAFADNRANPRREFFSIKPERVKSALLLGMIEDVTPGIEEVIPDVSERGAISERARKKQKTTMFDIGLEVGASLVFEKNNDWICEVVSERRVSFEGEEFSLSGIALKLLNQLGYDWKTCNGWEYWTFEGVRLSQLLAEYVDTK